MATYPIKMLKDEQEQAFVPLVSSEAIVDSEGQTLEDRLQNKLEINNLIAGDNITLTKEGNNCTITSTASGSPGSILIDNITTEESGLGALDAHQGKILNDKIPIIVNNLTTVDDTKALSAYQGYLLGLRSIPTGGTTGQILSKVNDNDYQLEWKDPLSINVIDDLTSTSITDALSANQGKELNEKIPTKISDLTDDSNFVIDANYNHTDNNYTSSDKNKLNGISSGAEVNVQSDWNASNGDAYIKNKPSIPSINTSYSTSSYNAYSCSYFNDKLDYLTPCAAVFSYHTDNNLIVSTSSINIPFNIVELNDNNCAHLSNNCITIDTPGLYRVDATVWVERCQTSYAWTKIFKNSNNVIASGIIESRDLHGSDGYLADVWQSITLSTIVYLDKGDDVYVNVYFSVVDDYYNRIGSIYEKTNQISLNRIHG